MELKLFQEIIDPDIEHLHKSKVDQNFDLGRIISEHRDRYKILTENGVMQGELLGNLRFTAESRRDLPAVGDWVAISSYDDDKALIHAIYPRKTTIERQAVGKEVDKQIIATNIDYALIVTSCGRDFNLNRIERYLVICHAAQVVPIIVLTKIDLADDSTIKEHLTALFKLQNDLPVYPVDNIGDTGINELSEIIIPGKTYCLMGSSGVGKSTLINAFIGEVVMDTGDISTSVNKGKHTTTHREMIILPNKGVIIDNPGMREVGITESHEGLEMTFDQIHQLAENCKYSDCTHVHEKSCAVLEALENGEIELRAYENYLKMLKEKTYFDRSVIERKQRDKQFGKLIKEVKKVRKKRKF